MRWHNSTITWKPDDGRDPASRTTPRTRAELKAEDPSLSHHALSRRYGVTTLAVQVVRARSDGRLLASPAYAALHANRRAAGGGEKYAATVAAAG